MNTKQFLQLLENHPKKELRFEYDHQQIVPLAYHITEIKNVHIESVDCGGRPDEYFQTVVQLWVKDGEKEKNKKAMTAEKALKIFTIVDNIKPLRYNTGIFFEWGHGDLKTATYTITTVEQSAGVLQVKMNVPPTVCKPALEMQESIFSGLPLATKCC